MITFKDVCGAQTKIVNNVGEVKRDGAIMVLRYSADGEASSWEKVASNTWVNTNGEKINDIKMYDKVKTVYSAMLKEIDNVSMYSIRSWGSSLLNCGKSLEVKYQQNS